MIQWTANSAAYNYAYLSLLDNRISLTSTNAQTAYLVKFVNDMDKSVYYCYPDRTVTNERYVELRFTWQNPPKSVDMYDAEIGFTLAGHYKYEIYEVTWLAASTTIADGNAPATETDVLSPAANDKGVVQGLVTKGIMNLTEETGQEQVQYTQREEPSGTNYIYYGQ